jgi:hypothetical protein
LLAFVVLDLGEPAQSYSDGYTNLAGRTMFVRADPTRFDAPWAAIAKLGITETDAIEAAHAAGLLLATNVCGADEDPVDCQTQADAAMAAGFHMLEDDFPAPVRGRDYWLDLPGGNPARCNPVTAPARCTAEALEDL